jgi:hypothetical protein
MKPTLTKESPKMQLLAALKKAEQVCKDGGSEGACFKALFSALAESVVRASREKNKFLEPPVPKGSFVVTPTGYDPNRNPDGFLIFGG